MMRRAHSVAVAVAVVIGTPTVLAAQVGAVSFANSGAPEAQSVFNHGVAQLHNFQYGEAAVDFREAQRIDPGFVMAYWGEAMTYNHAIWLAQDSTAARAVLSRLGATREERLERAATDRERAYLDAVEILYGTGAKEARDFAYSDAMRGVYEAYPDDPDAASFYALSILGTAHSGRDVATYIRAASVVEDVFDEHPNHPGAVHYLIHSYDDPVHAPLGLRAAQAYSRIAPDAAHAQHMTSHIFVAMGMWTDVVTANENARRVARSAAVARGEEPRGCGHYNYWLEYGYLQQGRAEDAHDLLRECYETASQSAGAGRSGALLDPDDTSRGSYTAMLARYVLDAEAWDDEALRWTVPLDDLFPARLTWAFVNGYAAAMRGELVTTEVSHEAIGGARRELDEYLRGTPNGGDANLGDAYRTRARILELQLEASLLTARGQSGRGLDIMREAADLEDGLPHFFGPPFVEKPSRELEGEMRLAADDPVGAATAFRAALARTPERVASARGLDRALMAQVAVHAPDEKSEVLAVVQTFFDAMAAGDSAAAGATMTAGAALVGTTEMPDGVMTSETSGADFLAMIARPGSALLERIWDATVMIRGAMAVVWTPYDFHRNGEFSHCGIDAVSLVRTNDGWRIASIVWTVERTGCGPSPLGPPGG